MALIEQLRQDPRLADASDDELLGLLAQHPQYRNLSDSALRYAAFGTLEGAKPQSDNKPGFGAGFSAGVDQMQAMGGGLLMAAGEKLGSESTWNAGRDVYQRNMAEAEENSLGYGFTDLFTDPDTSALQWASYTAGNLLPMLATSMVSGGVGGVGARMLAGTVAKQAATRAGQAIGAYAASAGMETGSIMGEVENADVALTHGSIAGALDALPVMRALRKFGGNELAKKAANEIADSTVSSLKRTADQSLKGAAGKGMLTQTLAESSTEGLQTLIEQHAKYWVDNNGQSLFNNLGEANWKEVIDAAAAGGLMGGAMGAPAGIVERGRAQSAVAAEEQRRNNLPPTEQGADADPDPARFQNANVGEQQWRNAWSEYDTPPVQRAQQRKDQAISQARQQTAAAGGDALSQAQAAQQAEQMADGVTRQEQTAQAPQRAAQLGNRIQMTLDAAADLEGLARGSDQGQARLRNLQSVLNRAESAYDSGNLDLAERLTARAEGITQNLTVALNRAGSRERPLEGQLAEPDRLSGLIGQDSAPRLGAPDPSVINMGGPTADTTQYDPQARAVRRDERMATQQQGASRMREQVAAQRPQITVQGIVYGQGETTRRGNANTGLDQSFDRASFTDTGAQQGRDAQRADMERQAQRVAELSRTRGPVETAYLPDNTPVQTRYRVVDLADLTASNAPDGRINSRYPQELQPRDRTNANSQVQVRNIAANLNPERLGRSSDAATGAPIIGPDGVVESGNGRTMALAQAYQQNGEQSRRYRDYVRQQAGALGMDPAAVEGMAQPVLVRERATNIDRAEFARRANESTVSGMSGYEQAMADADSLSADDLQQWSPDQTGDPLAASNRAFQRAFVSRLGNNEAARYATRDGQAAPDLGQRMQRAVFAKAYADPDMVEMATEQGNAMRNLTAALQSAAPDLAIARETGSQEALDAIDTINDAVRIVRRARQEGIGVRELVNQGDAFSDPVPALTAELALAFNNSMRSRRTLSDAARYIGQSVRSRAESERNGALFEDTTTNEDVFDAAFNREDPAARPEQRTPARDVSGRTGRGQSEPAPGREAEPAERTAEAEAVDDAPLLETYSERDLAERDRAREQAQQAETTQRLEQEQRAQADAEARDFTLAGSDRQADEAMARGQSDLLTDEARYSLGDQTAGTAQPLTADAVREALSGHAEFDDVEVIDHPRDLPPDVLMGMAFRGVSPQSVRGLYVGDQLYVIASNNDSLEQAVRTAVHETVGHKGMRAVLGDELAPVMRSLYRNLPHHPKGREALNEVLETYTFLDRNNPDDQITIAEEMVAHLLEKGFRPKAWQRAMAKIRSLLRKLFPTVAWTYTDVLALGEQSRAWLQKRQAEQQGGDQQQDQPLFSRRGWRESFPDAALAHPLRWLNSHPDYEAAKAGDNQAALRLARDAVTPEYVEQVRQLIPDGAHPRIVPVLAREGAGDNRIPQAAAYVLASRLGLDVSDDAVQVQKVSRTSASALDRLGRQPTFDGQVGAGDYVLIDDTLTQGGTLAQLKTHIEDQGGRVLGVTALTGKQYSRKLAVEPSVIEQVRDRFGSIENWWRDTFGHGFEGLTQSEARTLLKFDKGHLSPDTVRDRVSAARDEGVWPVDEGATGDRSGPEAPLNDPLYALASKRRIPLSAQFNDFTDTDRSAADKIGPKTPTRRAIDWFREHADRAGLKIRQGMVDRYAALLEIDRAAAGDRDVVQNSTASSSWVLARMANAANGALHAMLHNGRVYLDPDEKVIDIRDDDSKGLGSVLGRLGSAAEIERFMGWIAGNRSAKLAAEGRENLFEPAEIAAMRNWNRGSTEDGRNRAQLYDDVFKEFQQYRDDVLAIAEQSGIISADQRAMWRDEFYVPFYRVSEQDKTFQGPIATSGLSRQQAFKKLKGGTENLNDLLQNTMMNFHHLMEASLKNQAAMQAVENAEKVGIAQVVPESNRDTTNSTFVMRDGKKVFYQIDDPLVFKAITSLAHPGMNSTAMKVMRGFKRVFTNMTTVTPQFVVANLIRDSLQASATSQVSKNALANMLTGGRTLRDARAHARMMASGANFNFGHLYGDNPDELRAQLTRNMRNAKIIGLPGSQLPGVMALPSAAIRKLWAGWNEVNNFAENVNRAAVYQQNREAGRGKLYSAFESRDLMDFSAHGAWPAVRILIDIVPFLNARIQGLDKIYRSGIKPGANVVLAAFGKGQAGVSDKQAAARFWTVTGALAVATMALYAHNHDDEEYRKLEDWQKDTYWWFRVGDKAFFIPKPFEVGAIATLTERMLEQAMDDEATGALFRQRLVHMLTDTFSFSPVPQAFQPILNVYSNKDDFTGRPIESMGMDRLSPELRRNSSTTAAAQGVSTALNSTAGALGEWLGISKEDNPLALSPVQVDHLIQGYLGQVGAWAAGATDVGWRTLNGESSPAQRWYEYQPIRRFYQNLDDEDRYTKYGTLFYDGMREAQRAYSDVKELREMGELEKAREVADSKQAMLRLRPALNRAQSRLRTVNQQMDLIRRSNLGGEEKRQRMDRLRAVKNQIQRALGERVQEARAAS